MLDTANMVCAKTHSAIPPMIAAEIAREVRSSRTARTALPMANAASARFSCAASARSFLISASRPRRRANRSALFARRLAASYACRVGVAILASRARRLREEESVCVFVSAMDRPYTSPDPSTREANSWSDRLPAPEFARMREFARVVTCSFLEILRRSLQKVRNWRNVRRKLCLNCYHAHTVRVEPTQTHTGRSPARLIGRSPARVIGRSPAQIARVFARSHVRPSEPRCGLFGVPWYGHPRDRQKRQTAPRPV